MSIKRARSARLATIALFGLFLMMVLSVLSAPIFRAAPSSFAQSGGAVIATINVAPQPSGIAFDSSNGNLS